MIMKADELLDQLTRPRPGELETLVAAARTRARRRRVLRNVAPLVIVSLIALALFPWRLRPQAPNVPPAAHSSEGIQPAPLTGNELLDAFGDQPVALVTYPDGSQRLLSITRPREF